MSDLSASWQQRFTLIQQAGGPGLASMNKLSMGQQLRVWFNFMALLFGPFYYVGKGMWRKAITLSALIFAVSFVIIFIAVFLGADDKLLGNLGYGVPAVFCLRANVDYYKRMVQQDNGWW